MEKLSTESASERAKPLRTNPVVMRLYVCAVVILAVAGLVLVVLMVGWDDIGWTFSRPAMWLLLLLILLADAYPHVPWLRDVQGLIRIHWSAAVSMAAFLAFGPATLLAFPLISVVAVSSLGGALWRKVFNIAVVVLEGLAGALLVQLIWGDFGPDRPPPVTTLLVMGLSVALIWEAVNVLLIATAQTLSGASAWRQALRWCLGKTMFWLAGLTTAPLIAELALRAPILLPLLSVVIVAMHHTVAGTARNSVLARTDPLTGLPNRSAAMAVLDRRLGLRELKAEDVTVMLIDLDGFKAVNDTLGHQAGDQLLVEVGARIRSVVGSDSTVGRLGGDEFLVVGGTIPDPEALAKVIDANVRLPVRLDGAEASVSCSIGWANSRPGIDPIDLFRLVDRDLYRVKGARPAGRRVGMRPTGAALSDAALTDEPSTGEQAIEQPLVAEPTMPESELHR